MTQAGMRQVILQPQALVALLDQEALNGAAEIVFHNPRTNQPWDNDQAIQNPSGLRPCNAPTSNTAPLTKRLHAAVTRRKPPMDRQPNGPQGLGHDHKGLLAMDTTAIMNPLALSKKMKWGRRLDAPKLI